MLWPQGQLVKVLTAPSGAGWQLVLSPSCGQRAAGAPGTLLLSGAHTSLTPTLTL